MQYVIKMMGGKKIHAVLVRNFFGKQSCVKLMEVEDGIKMDHRKISSDYFN